MGQTSGSPAQERLGFGARPSDNTERSGTPISELFRMVHGTEPLPFQEAVGAIEAANIIPGFGRFADRIMESAQRLKVGRLADCPVNVEELAAVRAYSAQDTRPPLYRPLNAACYEPSRQGARMFVPFMWLLFCTLGKLPAFPNGTVFRGVQISEDIKRAMRAKYNKSAKGNVVMWHGFTSCTKDVEVLNQPEFGGSQCDRAIFVIELTQSQARDISSLSDFSYEKEVLLPPGCCFTILDVSDEQGQLRVHLKEVRGDWIQDLRAMRGLPRRQMELLLVDMQAELRETGEWRRKQKIEITQEIQRTMTENLFNHRFNILYKDSGTAGQAGELGGQGAQVAFWRGPLSDGINRGGEPYYCPEGFVRYSLLVPDFETVCKNWAITYHGTHPMFVPSILRNGLRYSKHCVYGTAVYTTPSIVYCCHPRFAKMVPRENGKHVQYVLECRVNPAFIIKKRQTMPCACGGGTLQIDRNFSNDELEWPIFPEAEEPAVTRGQLIVTGILMRVVDDPANPVPLPGNLW